MVELLDNKTYTQIAEILADKYGEKLFKDKGLGIEDMVSAYQRIYEEKGQALTPKEAYSEFVADCMTQMLADTNAIETIAKLRRVMDEPTQNKFIGKIRKAISEIKTYLKNISASKKNLVKDISAVTMQLDCLQNIADLWAKGVANSMNEFERLTKSENADSTANETVAYSKKVKYNNSDFSKALDSREWRKFNNLISTGDDAGLRISPTSLLVECENDLPYIYKYVRYNELSDDIVIEDVYAIGKIDTNYEDNVQFQAKIIAEYINKVKEYGYDNKQYVRKILSSCIKNTSYVLAGYSNKTSRYNVIGRGSRENGTNTFQKSDRAGSLGSSQENGDKFSVKTARDEFRTNAMIWANSADTKVCDTKILFGGGKGFALLEATENGYIEIARGDYDVVKGAKDYYERTNRAGEILDRYAKSLEYERRRNNWNVSDFENTSDERRTVGLDSLESNNDKARIDEQNRRDSEKFSLKSIPNNKVLLANALETVTQNDIERKYIRDYKAHINLLNEQEAKLKEINQEIGELSFAPSKRDTARLKELQEERIKTQNRINIYDKKLLRLEATKPLQNVINAEVSKFKNKLAAERQNEIESRYKTGKRHQIRQNFDYLSSLLISPKKQRNIGKMQH